MIQKYRRIWLVLLGCFLLAFAAGCVGDKNEENEKLPHTEISDNDTSGPNNPNEPENTPGLSSAPETDNTNDSNDDDTTDIPNGEGQETNPGETTTPDTPKKKPSVEPVYFEGDRDEILTQKLLLGRGNSYCKIAGDFFEHEGITDINNFDFLFYTDTVYYTAEDFAECSDSILKLVKNEIFARHGRMFLDQKLYTYFLTRMWYEPKYTPEEFDDSCLNDCERANLKVLLDLGA